MPTELVSSISVEENFPWPTVRCIASVEGWSVRSAIWKRRSQQKMLWTKPQRAATKTTLWWKMLWQVI